LILSLLGIRQWLARTIPRSLTLATGAGIGLFIAFIGLLPAGGIGVIGGDYTNLVGLGGCTDENEDPDHSYYCLTGVLRRPTIWIGIFLGGFLTVTLMMYRIRGAILCGILLVSIISWPRSTAVTYFPYTPAGDANFDFFAKVVTFRPIKYTLNAIDYDYKDGKIWLALITFLYVYVYHSRHSALVLNPIQRYHGHHRYPILYGSLCWCHE
jgi:adenine/guanine/hypoxanthine permease